MSASVDELTILRHFKVAGHARKAPIIKRVDSYPPPCYWVKCNSDGAARGSPGMAACGGLFRDNSSAVTGFFSVNLGIQTSLYAELFDAFYAMKIAEKRN